MTELKFASTLTDNRLLAGLPAADYQNLLPHLEQVSLKVKQVLYRPGDPLQYVYFPCSAVIAWLTCMSDGMSVEYATIGREGVVGVLAWLEMEATCHQAIVEMPGSALRMPAEVFRKAGRQQAAFQNMLSRYTRAFVIQVAQSVACNAIHSLKQRCCRWLLMTQDRVRTDNFPLTQDFLAQMLGVRRASVNDVASTLQQRGLIHYKRGKISIVNRAGLLAASCECYQAINNWYDRLLGWEKSNAS